MSSIDLFIDDIANLSINGITAKYGATLRNTVESAVLPYRFINHRDTGIQIDDYKRTTFAGTTYEASWVITDICLYRAINAGSGVADISINVYDYLSEFAALARSVATSKYTVIRFSGHTDLIEYPHQSDRYFDAIICKLFVKEVN
jgi:hypothetical protein